MGSSADGAGTAAAALRSIIGADVDDSTVADLLHRAHDDVQAAVNLHFEAPPTGPEPPARSSREAQPPVRQSPWTSSARGGAAKRASTPEPPAPKRARTSDADTRPADPSPAASAGAGPPPTPSPAPPTAAASKAAPAGRPPPPPRPSSKPLAERMRPSRLDELLGQDAALTDVLRRCVASDSLPNLLLWGPPGCGKTSFAHVIGATTGRRFRALSAAKAGVKELRDELSAAQGALALCGGGGGGGGSRGGGSRSGGGGTVLFVDEIHRWSKAQQDSLLFETEKGVITLIGATTENPSFSLNNAILSRCRLLTFGKIGADHLVRVLTRALGTDRGLAGVRAEPGALEAVASAADGDARVALNALELAASGVAPHADGTRAIGLADVKAALQRRALYDRAGDFHYDLISAVHKALRGGDADAALYYVTRMLTAGEEPRYVTRRLIRFAAEDIGLAEPRALLQALAADQAVAAIGMPEAGVVIAQAVVFLALAPKSVAVYAAYKAAVKACEDEPHAEVPLHIRNAPTRMMRSLGYADGYAYNPAAGYARGCEQGYLPRAFSGRAFFDPADCEGGRDLRCQLFGEEHAHVLSEPCSRC